MSLETQKAKEFAYWYFMLRDPELAAQKAGMENGILLLTERRVQTQLKRLRRLFGGETAGEIAKLGLSQILFSRPRTTDTERVGLDGFAVEEYSAAKDTKYKFWDKLDACELLLKLAEMDTPQNGDRFGSLLAALQQNAAQPSDTKGEEEVSSSDSALNR